MTGVNPLVDDTNLRIVQSLADGYRIGEIADELFLARDVLTRRLYKLRARAGAKTTTNLVAIALRRGWIK